MYAPLLKDVPLLFAHAEDDKVVPIADTEALVAALERAGGNVARLRRWRSGVDALGAENESWCEGHAKYVCEVAASDVEKVTLSLKVCLNDGGYEAIETSDYYPFSVEKWYRVSFSAIGDILTCTMQDDDPKASDYLDTVAEISANTTSLGDNAINVAGMGEFGCYSNSQLFRDFKIEDNAEW